MKNSAQRVKKGAASAPLIEHSLEQASLAEYLAEGAVIELLVSEFEKGTYRVEVSLSWKTGKAVLMAARDHQRTFRSLDTLANFLRSVGIGATVVRMELKP
jgi:divalent metal cation (Fe/Co/Zn/Cd) transporter